MKIYKKFNYLEKNNILSFFNYINSIYINYELDIVYDILYCLLKTIILYITYIISDYYTNIYSEYKGSQSNIDFIIFVLIWAFFFI